MGAEGGGMNQGREGKPFKIEKLSHGFPYATTPGNYLNSPACWREAGIIVAPDRETAAIHAAFVVGSSEIRVMETEG